MTESSESHSSGESGKPPIETEVARRWLALGVVVLVTAIVYLTALDYEYSWDDELFLEHSPRLNDISNLKVAFSVDFWGMTDTPTHPEASPLYRPLALGFLILEKAMFGERPSFFRLFHLLVHLANIILLFAFAGRILGKSSVLGPLLAAASLAAMPYTVDAVLFLTCISDLLATLFVLTALTCFVGWTEEAKRASLVGLVIASVAAVLSKESAVAIPLLFGAAFWCRGFAGSPKRAVLAIAFSIVAVVGFLILRAGVVRAGFPGDIVEFIKWLPADFAGALRWFVAPFPLVLEQAVSRSFSAVEWWLGIVGVAAFVAAVFLRGRKWAVALGGIAFWAVALAPSLVALQWTGVFAPRYLYTPTIGLALVVGFLGSRPSKVPRILLTVFLLGCGFLSLSRTTDWKDSVTLFAMEINNRPNSTSALINLGNLLARRGEYEKALPVQLRAAEAAEEQNRPCSAAFAYSNAATILAGKFGDDERAIHYFEKCTSLCPQKAQNAWMGIAQIRMRAGDWVAAEGAARKAQELGTQKVKTYSMLGAILTAQGRYEEAFSYLNKARDLALNDRVMLGNIEKQLKILRKMSFNSEINSN